MVATHSPIVVQELPKQTVNIIEKYGDSIIVRKPNIETFGETLGVLINEIFKFNPEKTGFYFSVAKAMK